MSIPLEETLQFAEKNGFRKIGLAFCTGLANEARMITEIFESSGFEVVSVCCKVGAIPKEKIGIKVLSATNDGASGERQSHRHNPLAAVYLSHSYYERLRRKAKK